MKQSTRNLIRKFTPMWTNKQIWEFDQRGEDLTFDIFCVKPKESINSCNSKSKYTDSDIRESSVSAFDHLVDGYKILISNKNEKRLDDRYIPYLMGVLVDMMIDDEICLNFDVEDGCLSIMMDTDADVIDCREFFEEFYHLTVGIGYDADIGIPKEQTEAEIYVTRLQDEFDEKMIRKLGDKYMPGNNDPDSIKREDK